MFGETEQAGSRETKSPWESGALIAICQVPETNEENYKELLYPKGQSW